MLTSQFELPSLPTLQFEPASSLAFTLPFELALAFKPDTLQLKLEEYPRYLNKITQYYQPNCFAIWLLIPLFFSFIPIFFCFLIFRCGYTRSRSFATLPLALRQVDGDSRYQETLGEPGSTIRPPTIGADSAVRGAAAAHSAARARAISGAHGAIRRGVSAQARHTAAKVGRIGTTMVTTKST